jgi:hypothetical protein
MPSAEVGAEVRRKRALNCWPWVRSLTHWPEAIYPFAGGNDSRMAHHRAMAARPRAQDAEAVLSVVVGHSLDEPSQHFLSVYAGHDISIKVVATLTLL